MRKRSLVLAAALAGGLLTAFSAPASASDTAYDLNRDGYKDIVVSAPDATVGGHKGAGAVVIQYGSANGPQAGKRLVLTQNSTGVPGTAEAGDYFGAAVTVADFDRDGYLDLFVGSPGEEVYGDVGGGGLAVLWGSSSGPNKGTDVPDPYPYEHDAFGRTFAVADFNSDGSPDLALGSDDCWIYLIRGDRDRSIPKPVGGIKADCSDYHGIDSLTAAEYNGWGYLVATGRGRGGTEGTGDAPGAWVFTGTSINNGMEYQGELPGGTSVAIGDITKDGVPDVVVGDPDAAGGGRVMVVNNGLTSPRATPSTTITQDTAGVPGSGESGDRFGAAVWLGDITKDGYRDLAVGAPGEDLGSTADAGSVTVLPGGAGGLTVTGSVTFTQSTAGVPGSSESADRFGGAVLLADVSKDGYGDLAVGAPGENGGIGSLTWLRGTTQGLTTSGATSLTGSGVGLSGAGHYASRFMR